MTESIEKKLERLRKIIKSKDKKRIAEKHGCSVAHIRNILLGYRINDEILESCIEEAHLILMKEKKRNQKLQKIKL